MFRRQALICVGIVLLSYLLAGCGVRPQVDFYVNPIATGEEQMTDAETGSVMVEVKGAEIKASAVSTSDLLEVTSDVYINPYVYVSDWGVARPRYTIFDVAIKNQSESELEIDLSNAVLMDEQGEQYEAISYEEFRDRYAVYPGLEREIVYYPRPYVYNRPPHYRRRWRPQPWYSHYDLYWDHRPYSKVYNVSYFKRAILKGTMLRSVRLYPGGKHQGFLVFPLVDPDVTELKIIFPDIRIHGKNVEFHFERTPAVKD